MKNPIQEIMPFSGFITRNDEALLNWNKRNEKDHCKSEWMCEIIIFVRDNLKQQETTKTQQEEAKVTTTMNQKESVHFS